MQHPQITHQLKPADYQRRVLGARDILAFVEREFQATVAAGTTFNFWQSDEAVFHTSGKINRQVKLDFKFILACHFE